MDPVISNILVKLAIHRMTVHRQQINNLHVQLYTTIFIYSVFIQYSVNILHHAETKIFLLRFYISCYPTQVVWTGRPPNLCSFLCFFNLYIIIKFWKQFIVKVPVSNFYQSQSNFYYFFYIILTSLEIWRNRLCQ